MSTLSESNSGFSVSQTAMNGITVLAPSGSLTHETCADVRLHLEEAATSPRAKIVLDCRHVKVMDSEALEMLTEWHARLEASRGYLKLSNLDEVCTDILVVTRLIHALNVQSTPVAPAQDSGSTPQPEVTPS